MVKRIYAIALWVSLLVTAALFVAELYFSGGFPQGIPWAVFGFFAIMTFVTVSAAGSAIQNFANNKWISLASFLVALFSVTAWVTVFLDQLPCFLGGKGC
jgi:hypothetical protein